MPTPKPRRAAGQGARARQWLRRIESSQGKSITDLAEQEGVTDAYVCRLLPLTCLAPDIVEAILDGRQRRRCNSTPARLLPAGMGGQRRAFAG
jgi:hypothetical protein